MIFLTAMAMSQAPTDEFYFVPDSNGIQEFYLEPRIEYDGHTWRPIMMQHHPECPCKNTSTAL